MQTNTPSGLDAQSTKSPLQSKTIWGGIAAAVPVLILIAGFFGVDIQDQAGDLTTGISGTVGLIGVVLVFVGRMKATKQIAKVIALLLLPAFLLSSCATTNLQGLVDCESRRTRAAHLRTTADLIDCPEPRVLPQTTAGYAK